MKGEWQGKPIVMILDHINGVPNDHRVENLRMVCPNCNSQLDTHCGKHLMKKHYFCIDCRKEIFKGSARCSECRGVNLRTTERPPLDTLLREIEDTSYSAVGRKYGVTDNTIRKWIKVYGNNKK